MMIVPRLIGQLVQRTAAWQPAENNCRICNIDCRISGKTTMMNETSSIVVILGQIYLQWVEMFLHSIEKIDSLYLLKFKKKL